MRKFGLVILILAILWGIPGFRGNLSAAALPALEKLGPAGEFVAKPVRNMVAKMRATSILRAMASDYNEGKPFPEEREFARWLSARYPDGSNLDPWGNPYWYQRTRNSLTVGSNGADGRKGTADDVKHSIPF